MAATRPSSSEWKAMKKRCVIVYGPMEGRMYFREDFAKGLESVFPGGVKENVLSFGPLSRNNEWFLCCKTDEAKDLMLAAGEILVKDKFVFRVRSADRDQFKARIHWAPPYLPNEVITDFLCKYGQVHAINFEKCTSKGFEGVRTGVRSVVMSGRKCDIPHIIPLFYENEKSELLVTVAGRQPLCLRCRQEGHYRRQCSTPFCRHCSQYGHLSETCAAAGSYASALREVTRATAESAVCIEEEEMEVVTEGKGEGEGEGEGIVKEVSEGGEGTAAGTAAQLASPEGGAPAAVQSAVASAEQPVAPVKKGVGRKPRGKKGKRVWLAAARELQRVDKERKEEVARKVEADKERAEKEEVGVRVTLGVSDFQPLQGSWADVSSDAMSEGESSGDDIPQWTEVRRKRKREVAQRDSSVSPVPSAIPLPTGKPPVADENTAATSGAFKKKCGADVRPRGEEV